MTDARPNWAARLGPLIRWWRQGIAPWLTGWETRSTAERALLSLGLCLIVLLLPSWPVAIFTAVLMTAAGLHGASLPLGAWLRAMAAPAGLALVLTVLAGILTGSPHGMIGFGLRGLAIAASLVFLALTTPVDSLVAGLGRLGLAPRQAQAIKGAWTIIFHRPDAGPPSPVTLAGLAVAFGVDGLVLVLGWFTA